MNPRWPIKIVLFIALICALLALVDPAAAQGPSGLALTAEETDMGIVRNVESAEVAPVWVLPAGKPGSWLDWPTSTCFANYPGTQYMPEPEPVPDPGSGGVGPQCQTNGQRKNVTQSCSCPVPGGAATIGGTRQVEVVCVGGFWWPSHYYACQVAGPPHSCYS